MPAITFPKMKCDLIRPGRSDLAHDVTLFPEGSTQTFKKHEVVKLTSGQLAARTSGSADECFAYTLEDASGVQGTMLRCILIEPGDQIEANFMATGGGNGTLAAADLGTAFELERVAAWLDASTPGWHIADATATPAVEVVSFRHRYTPPTDLDGRTANYAEVGDINARVRARFIEAVLAW